MGNGGVGGFFLKTSVHRLVIIDVIESLSLALVYNTLNNVHYIYRINEYLLEVGGGGGNLVIFSL